MATMMPNWLTPQMLSLSNMGSTGVAKLIQLGFGTASRTTRSNSSAGRASAGESSGPACM